MKLFGAATAVQVLALASLLGGASAQQNTAPELVFIRTSVPIFTRALLDYETPVQARFTMLYNAQWWNCIAAFSAEWKDTLTKERGTVVVPHADLHVTQNRAECGAQAVTTFFSLSLPGPLQEHVDGIANIGVTVEDTINPDVAACASGDSGCLQGVAEANHYTNTIMGHIIAKQAYDYAMTDGYNQLGTDNGCTVNCRNYSDVSGYKPIGDTHNDRWEPLAEDDDRGFFYRQEHVTPHIGQTAKFRNIPESDRHTRVAPHPSYSYGRQTEANAVIAGMAALDDTLKIQIEFFDNKNTVTGRVINGFVRKIIGTTWEDPLLKVPDTLVSFERNRHFTNGLVSAEYDATVIAWKEKVKFDLVRPTSIIKRRGDDQITTWAPGGTQTFAARDFEAYIRVMPHSEYVSGSACIFQAVEDYVLSYLEANDLEDPDTFPITYAAAAGSSKVEPGVVPAQDLDFLFPDIQTLSQKGGQSRIDGGMHFDESVTAAQDLCAGIGDYATTAVMGLISDIEDDDEDEECGLLYDECTDDPDACCPGYFCEYFNDYYSRCLTDPAAMCIAEWGNCLNDVDGCCYGLECVGDQWYKQCIRDS